MKTVVSVIFLTIVAWMVISIGCVLYEQVAMVSLVDNPEE